MSIFEGVKIATVDEFDGSKPLLDVTDKGPGDALVSLNCKYVPGKVQSRDGFAPAWTGSVGSSNNVITNPYYWSYGNAGAAATSYLAWYDVIPGALTPSNSLKVRNLITGAVQDLALTLPNFYPGCSFAAFGKKLYASFYSPAFGVSLALVWPGTPTLAATAFQAPMDVTQINFAVTQPGAGVCTAGTHYIGLLFQTVSGYWTRPGPAAFASGPTVLIPQSINSTGSNNIVVTISPTMVLGAWPVRAVQVIYTTSLNNFQYYIVPGTLTPTPGSSTVTITFSIDDLQLRSIGSQGAGTLADDYFGLLGNQVAPNTSPLTVKFQMAWGDRMVWFGNYGGEDVFFPSDHLNPEWISPDQHLLKLPNGLPIGAAFVLRGILYVISSAGGVFAYSDNGGRPVTFSPPQTVDSRISCQGPNHVTVAASGGYAFIMSDTGLYAYSGTSFSAIPLSYYQQPDLVAPVTNLGIKEFASEQTIVLHNSSGGSGSLYTFNYQNGITPEKVRSSKWTVNGDFTGAVSGIETVLNPLTNAWELWVAHNSGGILRQKSMRSADAALYTDFTDTTTGVFGIDQQYQTSLLPPGGIGEIFNHLALRVRAKAAQATVAVSGITKANPAVVTTSVVHGLAVGTPLLVTISGATGTGWTAINSIFAVTVLTQTTFSIPVNSTGFGTLGGTVIVTIIGSLAVTVKSFDDTISVVPVLSPVAVTAAPGRRYDMPYDLQSEAASYLLTNGAIAGNGIIISELNHAFNLFAVER